MPVEFSGTLVAIATHWQGARDRMKTSPVLGDGHETHPYRNVSGCRNGIGHVTVFDDGKAMLPLVVINASRPRLNKNPPEATKICSTPKP